MTAMYHNDTRTVATLDAGGTNLVFGAMRGCEFIIEPISLSAESESLDVSLQAIVSGFTQVFDRLEDKPVAISFAFPGLGDYPSGIVGGTLNFPAFRNGVALGPFLEEKFGMPVFINNDGNLFAFGEATGGMLPVVNNRIASLGGHKVYKNLIGFTLGTGIGIGQVINGHLNVGDNSCVEACFLRNKSNPSIMAEDGVSARAVVREYNVMSGKDDPHLTPYDVFLIAEGKENGDVDAARQSFAKLGEIAGDVFATAALLADALIVVGGGLTGAMKYIMPSLLAEMRSTISTIRGDEMHRLPVHVFNLEDEEEFASFAAGDLREIPVPGTDRKVIYDSMKRIGVAVSKIGASKAVSIGAYNFALAQMDSGGILR